MMISLRTGDEMKRDGFLRELARILYNRNDVDFHRGTFRVRGDVVEIFPPYEDERAIRVEFFGDFIDRLSWVDPLRGIVVREMDAIGIYPGSHHANTEEKTARAIQTIQAELQERLVHLKSEMKQLTSLIAN